MDESRFGLLTIQRRCLTIRGVKPITPYQHRFQNFYLYGAYSTWDGDPFILELPYCNGEGFQRYLDAFALHRPQEFKIILLDNGAFHKVSLLVIPPGVGLLFLPPYSPELNPAEQIWRWIKDRLANQVFRTLDLLSDRVAEIVRSLTPRIVLPIVGWELYKNCHLDA
jgi:transposase